MRDPDLAEMVERLATSVEAFGPRVNGLGVQLEAVKRDKASRWSLRAAWIGLALDLLLSLVAFAVIAQAREDRRDLHAAVDRLEDQQHDLDVTRDDVLCPLYTLILQSATPERRAATPPDRVDEYDATIAVIRAGAAALGCNQ